MQYEGVEPIYLSSLRRVTISQIIAVAYMEDVMSIEADLGLEPKTEMTFAFGCFANAK